MDLEVLHCCNHVLGVAKPAGLPVVPDASGDPSLLDGAKGFLGAEAGPAVRSGAMPRCLRKTTGAL